MTDFLLELRSEEIPARMQAKARDDLAKLFLAELAAAGLPAPAITTYATPRRLALIARDLPLETAAVSEEIKGPKSSAPPQALEGFLRKTGLTRDELVERDGVLFAVIDRPGRATADVLAEAIPRIIRAFPWPKSMRWGDASLSTESLKWVRPLQGIVALLGTDIVPCEIAGIASGRTTMGHRFHSTGAIEIESAATYAEQLRDAHVIVDQDERANIIAVGAKMAARKAGLTLIEDAGLLAENAGLTEWPVPLLGRFDEAFLSVPPEVIQLTARVNQKYFVCSDADGKLANAFICTANIDAADGGAKIIDGNRKVLAARLSDAKFFYDTDLKVPLDEQSKKLDRIVFHEKLGTVADKVVRVAKLARWLVEEGIVKSSPLAGRGTSEAGGGGVPQSPASPAENPLHHLPEEANSPQQQVDHAPHDQGSSGGRSDLLLRAAEDLADLAERAALLCKADLVTGMVGEFPELQGLMGGYYAAAQGEDPRIAAAIRDHYKPVGQGDDVPTDPVTVAVSLADKLDTLVGFFAIGEAPTGSRDPFALRRAALGAIRLILVNDIRVHTYHLCREVGEMLLSQTFFRLSEAGSCWAEVKHTALFQSAFRLDDDCAVALLQMTNGDVFEEKIDLPDELPDIAFVAAEISANLVIGNEAIRDFFVDRLKVQQREAGVRHDLIDAVFALGGEDDLVRLLARVHALQAFIGTPDGANLLAGYKRAANILKKEGFETSDKSDRHPGLDPGSRLSATEVEASPRLEGRGDGAGEAVALPYTPEPAEAALIAALDIAEPAAAAAVAAEDFEAAMAALASLRAPIDAFFETVIVNDSDRAKRAARLALLEKVRNAVHGVADFSKIEG
ncbi:glycine--tRNA ligase subunit beta [Sphingomonas sp. 32-62-10]|uniref:glycine--tRNA ligase subunit beta n=1 Tax=Sphingomonas sp. 32-62-10 TaxID=1970436 RepID=UPI000BC587DC|nr:MAG: glycine--tRNA ligase subunit beta [Sphingomonas sp. 32-62-10]